MLASILVTITVDKSKEDVKVGDSIKNEKICMKENNK